jgi:hypothetical protein
VGYFQKWEEELGHEIWRANTSVNDRWSWVSKVWQEKGDRLGPAVATLHGPVQNSKEFKNSQFELDLPDCYKSALGKVGEWVYFMACCLMCNF